LKKEAPVDESPPIFAKSLEAAQRWIHDLMEDLAVRDPQVAYRVLRGTLHALRDRLQPEEAVDLAAQLPTLIRGIYYEGWRPSATPQRQRTRHDFLGRVSEELVPQTDPVPEEAVRAMFRLLAARVSSGEISDVVGMLPEAVRQLWPGSAQRSAASDTRR
jgi:uncharacterized protein (DUF2267 family)